MIITWRYGQSVKLLEYDLMHGRVYFEALSGIEFEDLIQKGMFVVFETHIPDINRIVELIEEKFDLHR